MTLLSSTWCLHQCMFWWHCPPNPLYLSYVQVREAQLSQYNFILVVGASEQENGTVNVRTRDNQVHGEKSMEELLKWFQELKDTYQ